MSVEPDLYWVSGSPYSWRVTLMFAAKGARFNSHVLKPEEGDFDDPEFRKISPRGRVPTLTVGDLALAESLAIMAYVDRRYSTPPLFGETAEETGAIWWQILEFVDNMEPSSKRIVKTLYAGTEQEHDEELMECANTVRAELRRLNDRLDQSDWIASQRMSAVDFALYPFLKSLFRVAAKPAASSLGLRILPIAIHYPSLGRWMDTIERLPYFDSTYPTGWREDETRSTLNLMPAGG